MGGKVLIRFTWFCAFAQTTSVFAANRDTGDDKKEGFTDVLYPHRRIKITELLQAGEHSSTVGVQEETHTVTPPSKPTEGDVAKTPQGMSLMTRCNK
jgi:Lon-like ATP-dependent protease